MEEILPGGDMTRVVRVGDTVRRATGPWTPAIHALLDHLRSRGFDRAPEALGTDEQGREIISLLPGAVATYPLAAYVMTDRMLVAVARMIREYHDATADFRPPDDTQWQWPAHEPAEVLCHNDFAPYNLMFEGQELVGVIDFDTASPGPRVWDLAYTAYRFVPLTDPANPDVPYPGVAEQRRRLALFVSAYGIATIAPADVVAIAVKRLRELVEFIVEQAAAGDPAQQAVLDRGDTVIYERDIAYLEANRSGLSSK
ncbi:aminoglycoside phosphotransferase family protein [Rhodococcus sp. D2-41]|uniref:Aminoglycoside phosphotransferase family protein n=1 Tax=Speluncibacter jeojiensis TaxID=2710754 RepID=A0A9X4RDF2_9ACTN|nr:aminoglycoside phosphotransferase family protein [Rhodococcus sp. D2-41]MDG3009792.1 aminoglycoside phosphotransferase family protein [Rhodococcus sp. D2-41]MDG3014543.1 aminoglycoside phosphotransferase family protein [Corynebacteriales bacterium D3-21]